jgi:hypothetical protein
VVNSSSIIIIKVSKSQPPTKPSNCSYLMYEDAPRYDWITKTLIAAILVALLVAGIVLLFYAVAAGMALLGDTLLVALIFYFVFPRRYQVFNTKLRIVLGWPLGWDIPLSTIEEAHAASGIARWVYWGVRLATSSETAVEIVRKKGMNVIISPSNRETFLERLNDALKAAQGSQ